jgi:hypothetical protein
MASSVLMRSNLMTNISNSAVSHETIHSSHPHSHLQIHRMSRRETISCTQKKRPSSNHAHPLTQPPTAVGSREGEREKGAAGSRRRGKSSKGEGGAPRSREPVTPESRRPRRRLVEGRRRRIEPAATLDRAHRRQIEPATA